MAEPVVLVDIVPGDVVVSLCAVQYGRSADHPRTPPVASSRAAATPLKNVIVVLRHPSRQTRRRQTFWRPTLLDLMRARAETGKPVATEDVVRVDAFGEEKDRRR